MTPDAHKRTIGELAPLISSGQLRSEALTVACLEAIRRDNGRLNAFITICGDEALAAARVADAEIRGGRRRGPLHGIPISFKDLIDVTGLPTSAASRLRAGHRASADAPLVTRLRHAGAVIVGKTNLHEFAFGTTSEDSAFGPVRNPADPDRSPGGSSGGSAAGIVAGMSVGSIGTDTGGSVRIPAAACGTVGLKPAFGEIPCEGVVPLSPSLDHVGPLARSVGDAWILYEALVAPTPEDTRAPAAAPDLAAVSLVTLRPYFFEVLDDEVRDRVNAAIARLRKAGARIAEGAIPHAADTPGIYMHVQLPEASAYHASSLETHPELYSPSVRLRLELGRYVLAEDYARAQTGRAVLRAEVDSALAGHNVLVLPTLPIPAPRLGQDVVRMGGADWQVRGTMLRLTQLFNLTGHPAITLPCGCTRDGLPCGLQLVGRIGATRALLGAALACERALAGGA